MKSTGKKTVLQNCINKLNPDPDPVLQNCFTWSVQEIDLLKPILYWEETKLQNNQLGLQAQSPHSPRAIASSEFL